MKYLSINDRIWMCGVIPSHKRAPLSFFICKFHYCHEAKDHVQTSLLTKTKKKQYLEKRFFD